MVIIRIELDVKLVLENLVKRLVIEIWCIEGGSGCKEGKLRSW